MPPHLLYRKIFLPEMKKILGDNKEAINKYLKEKWRSLSPEQKEIWRQKALDKWKLEQK